MKDKNNSCFTLVHLVSRGCLTFVQRAKGSHSLDELKVDGLRQTDTNISEAIRQEEIARPSMPSDLNSRLVQNLKAQEKSVGEKKKNRSHLIWPWIAAACVTVMLSLFLTHPKEVDGDMVGSVVIRVENDSSNQKIISHTLDEQKIQKIKKGEPLLTIAKEDKKQPSARRQREMKAQFGINNKQVALDASISSGKQRSVENNPSKTNLADVNQQMVDSTAAPQTINLSDRDVPIMRPENYKYTREEISLLKKQANETYLKWVELELEIAKYNLEQTAQK